MDSRVAIVGPNGAGKSTFLKVQECGSPMGVGPRRACACGALLPESRVPLRLRLGHPPDWANARGAQLVMGEIIPSKGWVNRHCKLRLACFTQHHIDMMARRRAAAYYPSPHLHTPPCGC